MSRREWVTGWARGVTEYVEIMERRAYIDRIIADYQRGWLKMSDFRQMFGIDA